MKYLRYLWALLRHKWFVGLYCFHEGLFWRGIIHDWSKFLPDEFVPYTNYFYGNDKWAWKDRFDLAWNKHQKRHDHHWQWWLLTEDMPSDGVLELHDLAGEVDTGHALLNTPVVLPMSDKARREMLCDWRGANRAYNAKQTLKEWYLDREFLMWARVHPETVLWVEEQLGV